MDQAALEELCDRWLAAWTGDAERLLAFYTTDAYYEDPAKPQGLRGHAELRPYLTKLLARNPDWKWTRRSLHIVEGGFVVRHEAMIPLKDGPLRIHAADYVQLDDAGRITHNEVYFDRSEWMKRLAG